MSKFTDLLVKHRFEEPRCHSGVGDGWLPILDRLLPKLAGATIAQIKEKFGGLRVYLGEGATDEMYAAISDAEREAWVTCEDCGAPGSKQGGGWIRVLCDSCAQTRTAQRGR